MSTTETISFAVELAGPDSPNRAEVAAAAFSIEAYRYDLRSFFQWAADAGLDVLCVTRPHIELFRSALEARRLAAATIDRRLSTVCGFYRSAHIDGRIASNPAQYVRRPTVHRPEGRPLRARKVPLRRRALRSRPWGPRRPARAHR